MYDNLYNEEGCRKKGIVMYHCECGYKFYPSEQKKIQGRIGQIHPEERCPQCGRRLGADARY